MCTLVVIETVGDLVHYVGGLFEEAEEPIVDVDADVVLVLLQAEAAEEEVLHPMVFEIHNQGFLR